MSEVSAYHEAGHALMAVCLGGRVRSLTIEPDWDDGPRRYGDAQVEWYSADSAGNISPPQDLREKSILVALAGPVAEMIYRGQPYHPGLVAEWAADWEAAWEAAQLIHPDERTRLKYLEQATVLVYQTLNRDEHWAALAAIVDSLVAHETLEADQVAEIVAQWL